MSGVPSGIAGMIIADGNKMMVDIKQSVPTYGGLALISSDGTGTGAMDDITSGQPFYLNAESDGQWHHFVGSLSPYANMTVSYALAGIHLEAPNGIFDIWMTNAVIVHSDGSVTPILTGQATSVTGFTGNTCGGQPLSSGTQITATADPQVATNYYLDDHLGTTQMELSAGGWPLLRGQFTPFGQEVIGGAVPSGGLQPADGTSMHYKFTGKERDTESGLDYFGARYYGSNMGRWMSPDWSAKASAVPTPSSTIRRA